MRLVKYILTICYIISSLTGFTDLPGTVLPGGSVADTVFPEIGTLSPKIQIDQPVFLAHWGEVPQTEENGLFPYVYSLDARRKAWANGFADLYRQNLGKDWNIRLQAAMWFLTHDIAGDEVINDLVLRKKEYNRAQEVLSVRRVLGALYSADEDVLNLYDLSLMAVIQNVKLICGKCGFPHGFLNVEVNEKNGICSACTYLEEHPDLSKMNMSRLEDMLAAKIEEAKGVRQSQPQTMKAKYDYDDDGVFQVFRDIDPEVKYDCVVGFSGGKDSVYVAYQLLKEYGLSILLVFDDIEVSSELAKENIDTVVRNLRDKFGRGRVGFVRVGFKKGLIGKVRSDFMKAGQGFCRACLRSHWGMGYREAINAGVPLFFYGFSRLQHFPDIIGTKLAQDTVTLVSTPFHQIDRAALAELYSFRATVHNLEIGYRDTAEQKELYNIISNIYFKVPEGQVMPLLIPYFLFIQAPEENTIKQIISQEVGWKIPPNSMGELAHTNCRFEDLGEVMYRSITGSSTKLRELGVAAREGSMPLRKALDRQIREITDLSVSKGELTRALNIWGGISAEEVLKNNTRISWYFKENNPDALNSTDNRPIEKIKQKLELSSAAFFPKMQISQVEPIGMSI